MTLQVRNSTGLDTAWLERMVDAVTPAGLADFSIEFLPHHRHHGFAYVERRAARVWLAEHDGEPPIVEGIDNCPTAIPNAPGRKRSLRPMLLMQPKTLQEVAVFLTAHELLHLWQAEHGKPIDARYPDLMLFCERDANAHATRMLRRWRRHLWRAPN